MSDLATSTQFDLIAAIRKRNAASLFKAAFAPAPAVAQAVLAQANGQGGGPGGPPPGGDPSAGGAAPPGGPPPGVDLSAANPMPPTGADPSQGQPPPGGDPAAGGAAPPSPGAGGEPDMISVINQTVQQAVQQAMAAQQQAGGGGGAGGGAGKSPSASGKLDPHEMHRLRQDQHDMKHMLRAIADAMGLQVPASHTMDMTPPTPPGGVPPPIGGPDPASVGAAAGGGAPPSNIAQQLPSLPPVAAKAGSDQDSLTKRILDAGTPVPRDPRDGRGGGVRSMLAKIGRAKN